MSSHIILHNIVDCEGHEERSHRKRIDVSSELRQEAASAACTGPARSGHRAQNSRYGTLSTGYYHW